MKNVLQKQRSAEAAFRSALQKDIIKTQKYVEKLTKSDVNKIIRDLKFEERTEIFKNFVKGMMIQYDHDWELIQDIIEQAFENVRGNKKKEKKNES